MAILTDAAIKQRFGELFSDGLLERAKGCSYLLTPYKVFRAPEDGASAIEPQLLDQGSSCVINPGELVWIRFKERVSIPQDLCGIWAQTNTFSRQGIFLINASLIEPGYTGYLTAAFVNFGKVARTVTATESVARVLFASLSARDASRYKGTRYDTADAYDQSLAKLVVEAPKTFLNIDQIHTPLTSKVRSAAEEAKREALASIDQEVVKKREAVLEDIVQRGFKKALLGGGLGGLALAIVLGLISYFGMMDRVVQTTVLPDERVKEQIAAYIAKTNTQPDLDEIGRRLVPDDRLGQAVQRFVQSSAANDKLGTLDQRLKQIEDQLAKLPMQNPAP